MSNKKETTLDKKLKEIKAEMKILSDVIDNKRSKCNIFKLGFEGFSNIAREEQNKHAKLHRQYRMLQIPKLSPIPDYGDRMSLKDFIANCECGGFIDYDGSGNYATENEMSDINIYASDIEAKEYRKDFDRIIWFNR